MVDTYTKIVLTVIAASLVSISIQIGATSAQADRFGKPVMIGGVSTQAAKCLAEHLTLTGGETGDCIAAW